MDSVELGRRLKRNFESFFSYRRMCLGVITTLVFFMYVVPYLLRWFEFSRSPTSQENDIDICIQDRLTSFYSESFEYNVNIKHIPVKDDENPYVSYVGNGVFGVDINKHSQVFIKHGRNLVVQSFFDPILYLQNFYMTPFKEAVVTNYLTGIVHVFQCYKGGVYASYQYYAHRTLQSILVQDIKVSNPTDLQFEVIVQSKKISPVTLLDEVKVPINIKQGDNVIPYILYNGFTNVSDSEVVAISLAQRNFPIKFIVQPRSSKQFHFLTSLNYSMPMKKSMKSRSAEVERSVVETLKKASAEDPMHLKEKHAKIWQDLWSTGLTIGTSKAKDALNGDKINATMYYVLSQVKN